MQGPEIDASVISMLLESLAAGHVGVCLCDADDRVRFVNQTFRLAFFPGAPDVPFDFVDAIAADIAAGTGIRLDSMPLDVFVPRVRDRRRNGAARHDFTVDLTDGSWWWVNDHRLDNGWILVVATDISSTKSEELRLRAAHAAAIEETRTDSLTGVASRKYGLERAEAALAEHRLVQLPLCVAILDIDHFKKVNDTFGHATGDEVLVHFGRTLASSFGEGDQISRLGGEEFLIVMQDTPQERAQLKLQRVLLSLKPLPGTSSRPQLTVTFSAGVALAQPDENLSSLLRRADDALYEAKLGGRASIRLATPRRNEDAA